MICKKEIREKSQRCSIILHKKITSWITCDISLAITSREVGEANEN